MSVRCETWHDGTWWEADPPAEWSFRQDRSIRGWPYVFESPGGAHLWVAASKHNDIGGWDFSIAPSTLSHEQKKAFLLAASDVHLATSPPVDLARTSRVLLAARQHAEVVARAANLQTAAKSLTRVDLGVLVGFTYSRAETTTAGWSGYFSHDPWMLRLSFVAPSATATQASGVAQSIAASIRFKDPVETPPH